MTLGGDHGEELKTWSLKEFLFPVAQPVEATDDVFWDQFWAYCSIAVQDVFALVPSAEIRAVREESPSNLATLCYKVIFPYQYVILVEMIFRNIEHIPSIIQAFNSFIVLNS